jgi:hypothetical protein
MGEWFEKKTLGTLLNEAAGRWGAREALTYEGSRWSVAPTPGGSRPHRQGLHPPRDSHPETGGPWMPNRPEWLYTFFALAKIAP